jgi:putative phosphoribosyl transferase
MPRAYADRREAGRRLADELRTRLHGETPVVLALARGGVPVGIEVARGLDAPLDVLVARKIGAPMQPELGVGAMAEGGVTVLADHRLAQLGLSEDDLDTTITSEGAELDRRVARYRGGRPPADVRDRVVVVVDDGLATGVTAQAALRAVRAREPKRLVLAVPVGSRQAVEMLTHEVDEIVCPMVPRMFRAVGLWYRTFDQTSDDEVVALLSRRREEVA